MSTIDTKPEVKNPKRRLMLAFGATGLVAFVLGKVFGDNDNYFLPKEVQGPVKVANFANFTLTESEEEIVLTERDGETIVVIDK